jgi:hypothetical protein
MHEFKKILTKSLIVIPINFTKRIYCGKSKWYSKHLCKSLGEKIISGLILVIQQALMKEFIVFSP